MQLTLKDGTRVAETFGVWLRYRLLQLAPRAERPAPPYVKCAGCRRGGRNDQHVPDPDQFVTKRGVTPAGDVVGNAAVVPAVPAVDVDAVEDVNWGAFNSDPGAAAERLSEENARRGGYGPDVTLIDAPPVWCGSCGRWYHAIRCYSLHRHT